MDAGPGTDFGALGWFLGRVEDGPLAFSYRGVCGYS
jgi:hypothetical protein